MLIQGNTNIRFQKLAFESYMELKIWKLFHASYLQCWPPTVVLICFISVDLLRVKS